MIQDIFKYRSTDKPKFGSEEIQNIIEHIADDESKAVFSNCFMYSVSKELFYIRKNIMMTRIGQDFYKRIKEVDGPIVIFGSGKRGKRLMNLFPEIRWSGFVDNDQSGTYRGYLVTDLKDAKSRWSNAIYVISVLNEHENIEKELIAEGLTQQQIVVLEKYNMEMERTQYIDEPMIPYDSIETWIDAGGYDGNDTGKFLSFKRTKFVYTFEPDPDMWHICNSCCGADHRVKVLPHGIYDKNTVLGFEKLQGGLSNIYENGNDTISVKKLDEIITSNVQFIKMDIEGTEYKALIGAKRIICQDKPYMAISVYHKEEDIWQLPSKLLEYNPDYRFSFRHYSIGQVDTVMYVF